MIYSIETLEKEKRLIDGCLAGFDKVKYHEAFKRQKQKSKELQKAISKLKSITNDKDKHLRTTRSKTRREKAD